MLWVLRDWAISVMFFNFLIYIYFGGFGDRTNPASHSAKKDR